MVKQSTVRHNLNLGPAPLTAATISKPRVRPGEMLHIHVLGLASIARDVTPELGARSPSPRWWCWEALHASPAVKAALADRIR